MDDLRQSIKVLIIESLNLEDITPADIDDDAPLFGTDWGEHGIARALSQCRHAGGFHRESED